MLLHNHAAATVGLEFILIHSVESIELELILQQQN